MQVRVRLFAMQRQQVGWRERDVELPAGATVGDAWSALVAAYPVLEPSSDSVRFARNAAYAETGDALREGDELAVIPPVAGGAAGDEDPAGPSAPGPTVGLDEPRPVVAHPPLAHHPGSLRYRRIELHDEPFPEALPGELRRQVPSHADGALVLFVGQTRESPGTPAPGQESEAERHRDRHVQGLAYEAFEEMALAVLGTIADEIEARFGVRRLAILHRTGEVPLGEASVVIAVAAPHREAAFLASRYAIEELKARAPIWKSERFTDGSVWIGAPARTGPAPVPGPAGPAGGEAPAG